MSLIDELSGRASTVSHTLDGDTDRSVAAAIERGSLRDVEVMWLDHQGHARGKRIDAVGFLERARGEGFAFCSAALTWDITGEVKSGLRHSDWETGFPDFYATPDLASFRLVPWRERAGHVICDLVDEQRRLVGAAPRTVLRQAIDRLAALGYRAKVGVEIEFHLLDAGGTPLIGGMQTYSLQVLNQLDPVFGEILDGLRGFVELEGATPSTDLANARSTWATPRRWRRPIRRRASSTPRASSRGVGTRSPPSWPSRSATRRATRCTCTCRCGDDEPAFAAHGDAENPLMRHAIGGILRHLPGIVLYGAPTVNSYKRFELHSFAPTSVSRGADNRTVAVRSLVSTPEATRIELRTGAADAQPHWAIASLLAAVAAGIEAELDPGRRGEGNVYGTGEPLPSTLADAVAAARDDATIIELLGEDAVHDYAALAQLEWQAFIGSVGDWDRERYLRSA